MDNIEDEIYVDEVVNEDVNDSHNVVKCIPQVKEKVEEFDIENVDVHSRSKAMRDEYMDVQHCEGMLKLQRRNNIKESKDGDFTPKKFSRIENIDKESYFDEKIGNGSNVVQRMVVVMVKFPQKQQMKK